MGNPYDTTKYHAQTWEAKNLPDTTSIPGTVSASLPPLPLVDSRAKMDTPTTTKPVTNSYDVSKTAIVAAASSKCYQLPLFSRKTSALTFFLDVNTQSDNEKSVDKEDGAISNTWFPLSKKYRPSNSPTNSNEQRDTASLKQSTRKQKGTTSPVDSMKKGTSRGSHEQRIAHLSNNGDICEATKYCGDLEIRGKKLEGFSRLYRCILSFVSRGEGV